MIKSGFLIYVTVRGFLLLFPPFFPILTSLLYCAKRGSKMRLKYMILKTGGWGKNLYKYRTSTGRISALKLSWLKFSGTFYRVHWYQQHVLQLSTIGSLCLFFHINGSTFAKVTGKLSWKTEPLWAPIFIGRNSTGWPRRPDGGIPNRTRRIASPISLNPGAVLRPFRSDPKRMHFCICFELWPQFFFQNSSIISTLTATKNISWLLK